MDPTLESCPAKNPEPGELVPRVVINKAVVPERVVSLHFDRTMKGKPCELSVR